MKKASCIRVAIIGVGNCANSLVQGVYYYRKRGISSSSREVPGIMHQRIGPYMIGDIHFSAAFDVDARKVGKDLSAAIFAPPNCALPIHQVSKINVPVSRGRVIDSMNGKLADVIPISSRRSVRISEILRKTKTDVVVNYLPTGSDKAARFYAQEALRAGCAFINCMPTPIATSIGLERSFRKKGVPIIGDDIKSQVGATILHRAILKLMKDRGVKILSTSQINIGGNTDFLNFVDRSASKELTKRKSLLDVVGDDTDIAVHTGLHFDSTRGDQKWAYIFIEGEGFGRAITKIQIKLDVEDSPNSAGIVVDAIRCAKLGMDRGIGGVLSAPSAYFMKHSSIFASVDDDQAKRDLDEFINPS